MADRQKMDPVDLWMWIGAAVCLAYALLMLPAVQRSPLWPYFQPRLSRWRHLFTHGPVPSASEQLVKSPSSTA